MGDSATRFESTGNAMSNIVDSRPGLRNWKLVRLALPKNLRSLLGPCPADVTTAARQLEAAVRAFWRWQLEAARRPAARERDAWKNWPEGKRAGLTYEPPSDVQKPAIGFDRRAPDDPDRDPAYSITGLSQFSRGVTLGWMLPDKPAPKVGALTPTRSMRVNPPERERDRAIVAGAVSRATLEDFPGPKRWALLVAWIASRVHAFNSVERAWSLKAAATFLARDYSAPVALAEWASRHVTGGRTGGHGRLKVAEMAELLLDRDGLLEKLRDYRDNEEFADPALRRALIFGRPEPVWSEADVLRGELIAAASK